MSMTANYLALSPAQLEQAREDLDVLEELLFPDGDDAPGVLDIDQAWHLIHFLLNGKAWDGKGPLFDAVLGGAEIDGAQTEQGPVRFLEPDQVRATAEALATLTSDELWSRFDLKKVKRARIHPEGGWSHDEENRDYLHEHFDALKAYFAKAGADGKAMLLFQT